MKESVSKTDLALMLIVAILFDLTQGGMAILLGWIGIGFLAGPIISLFAIPSYFIWFSIKGLMDIRMGMRLFGASLGEMMPVVDALPLWSGLIASIMINEGKKELGPLGAAIPTGPGASTKK